MTTVRELMTDTYGPSFELGGETFSVHRDQLAIKWTTVRDVFGYEDTIGIANYRVLEREWGHLDGFTRGPYSNCDVIGLELDSEAPDDLLDVLDALEGYPCLDDEEESKARDEMTTEHWEMYGELDARELLAAVLGVDKDDLSDHATDILQRLTFGGIVNWNYPDVIDPSMVEFHTDEIVLWISTRMGRTVTVGREVFDFRRKYMFA